MTTPPHDGDSVHLSPSIRVLIVDVCSFMRSGLATALARIEGVEVVGELGTAEEALTEAPHLRPDLVVLDYSAPNANGADTCQDLLAAWPDARLLILTRFASMELERQAFRAGAAGFMLKASGEDVLRRAVEVVAAGETFSDPALQSLTANGPPLSDGEIAVLRRIAGGETSEEAAETLRVSQRTAQTQIDRAMAKLGVHRRAAAVAEIVRRGLA